MRGSVLTPDAQSAAQTRSGRLCCALLFSFAISAELAVAQEQRIDFNIVTQPLDEALDAFGAVTGFQIFYETALTSGRRSREVKGVLDRETALRVLLSGSGLTARTIATRTITIAPLDDAGADLQQAKRASVAYYGFMQASIMRVLCQSPETGPGAYRATMQYWIDGSGRATQFRLIASSGDADRDIAIKRAIQTIVFQPPLRTMPQPITLAIEPSPREELAGCVPRNPIAPVRVQ
jgi:hypothetical protein